MLCACSSNFTSDEGTGSAVAPQPGKGARVFCAQLRDGKEKLLQGSIREAEASLREALSINDQEARTLLGRLEYDRGNYEKALRILEEIQADSLGASLQYFVSHSSSNKKGRQFKDRKDGAALDTFVHAASLLLEALYLKAKCLQELGRLSDASHECKLVLDTMERITPAGLPDAWGKTRMAEMLSKSVKLHPELLLELGRTSDAMVAYRRSFYVSHHV